ncbi:MAG: hypothetical protein WCG02_02295 [Candidatus Taylorbacteria bacterium]
MDDNQNQDASAPTEVGPTPETPVSDVSSQPTASTAIDMPPEALESPTNASSITLGEDQNRGINQPESNASDEPISAPNEPETPVDNQPVSESTSVQSEPTVIAPSAPAPQTPPAPQAQSPAQPDQTGFIRALLAKAQAKIQSNKQKKLDKIILFTQKKKMIANEDIQKLLHISSATATRYLVKLVQQGRLARVGNPRDAKYQFLH